MNYKEHMYKLAIAIVLLSIVTLFLFIIESSGTKLNIIGDDDIVLELNQNYIEQGAIATSNRKDYSSYVEIDSNVDTSKIGKYTVFYSLDIDFLNIYLTKKRTVEVKDTIKPEIKVDSTDELYVLRNSNFEYPNASASDNYDGDISDKIKINSNVDLNNEGKYQVSYLVEDSSGNKDEKTINVNVVAKKQAYIEISIKEQKLRYYEYGKLILTSDVVTGINNYTPIGNFRILHKARNTTLVGRNYRSFVNYFMDFLGNKYGLHDASWRNKFGGEIYKTNGSHGCVNMPYESIKALYELVEIGTPVYIYNTDNNENNII